MLYIKNYFFLEKLTASLYFTRKKYSFKIQFVNQVHHPFKLNLVVLFKFFTYNLNKSTSFYNIQKSLRFSVKVLKC